jgi:HSP20 family molecular chaperone IbpA
LEINLAMVVPDPTLEESISDGPGYEEVAGKGPEMILLRGGRHTNALESSFEIDVMVDFGQAPMRGRHQRLAPWRPPVDVFETGGGLVVRAELGGLTTSEVQVLLSGNELSICGQRDVVRPLGSRVYHESRIRYGRFEAVVRLPFAIDAELTTAEYADGLLSVELPRLAATRLTKSAVRGDV